MKKTSVPFIILIIFLYSLGTFLHLVPLFNTQRLMYSITDDGYYMLTVARNISIGKGMSVADGLTPTNGIQPLYTFILAGAYKITGGDKIFTLNIIVLIQFITSVLTSIGIWKIGLLLYKDHPNMEKIALFASAVWFSNYLMIVNAMNGLETGFYALSVLVIIWITVFKIRKLTYKSSTLLGLLLGITFWIRNDVEFLVIAIFIMILIFKPVENRKPLNVLLHIFIIGISAFLITLPWLIYNKINFGNFIPISGQSEMISANFAGNLPFIPPVLFEYFSAIIPIPHVLKINLFIIFSTLCLNILFVAFLFKRYKSFSSPQKKIFIIISIFTCEICLFYGIFFDTFYFLPRYLFPVSAFFLLLWSACIFNIFELIHLRFLKYSLVIIFIILVSLLSYYRFLESNTHKHFQIVNWINKNVDSNEWVGANQSGTVGYFHDKTINLDGKVNPEALKAWKSGEPELINYIVNKKIDYVLDWYGLSVWNNYEIFKKNYDIIVDDKEHDIVVFKKKN